MARVVILNPQKPKRKRRVRHINKSIKRGPNTMAITHKRRRKSIRRHHKHNPGMSYAANPHTRRKRTGGLFRKAHRRYRRNPESVSSIDPAKGNNALEYIAGALVSAIATPTLSNMFGFTGYTRYGIQLAVGYGFYMLGKSLGMPKAGLAAAITAAGLTANEFAKDQGILSGVQNLLGIVPQMNSADYGTLRNFAKNISGFVPNPLHGYVPAPGAEHPATFAGYN